ncbi:hypothetical protein PUN4_1150041 [Paraburkholderia unamae]|nr:hypothetical protein PUN4_1150041 [Paraburkholderia unamae]
MAGHQVCRPRTALFPASVHVRTGLTRFLTLVHQFGAEAGPHLADYAPILGKLGKPDGQSQDRH